MNISGLGEFALGQSVPNRDHAVCVSIPTIRDLIGYEEKKTDTLKKIKSGYPRFVQHRMIKELIQIEKKEAGNTDDNFYIFANGQLCQQAVKQYSIQNYNFIDRDQYSILQLPRQPNSSYPVKSFLQHTGGGISSRLAEEILIEKGTILKRENIAKIKDPDLFARKTIAQVHGVGVTTEGVLITSSGANAFYSLFKNAQKYLDQKGKKIWIQLGWLYLDTIEAIKLICKEDHIITLHNPTDLKLLQETFLRHGEQIAGIITEFPTNPLLQSCDLIQVRALCDQFDAMLIIDPTMASPKNSKVAEFADALVNSLTKYASWEGDLMIGSLVFPNHSKIGKDLLSITKATICRPFNRDLLRLCEQLPFYSSFVEKTNHSLLKVVNFLESSSDVNKVFWSYQKDSQANFKDRAGEDRPGCVVSFELNGNFENFYNRLRMLKSPSFGTEFSICCPYVYLAHYDLTQTKKGLQTLQRAGISPNLCRLSVGLENPDEIIQTLKDAFRGMKN